MISFLVNGDPIQFAASPDTPLLWALRDNLGLTGTKYGCGLAQCGACTVIIDGKAVRSCVTPMSTMQGKPLRFESASDVRWEMALSEILRRFRRRGVPPGSGVSGNNPERFVHRNP